WVKVAIAARSGDRTRSPPRECKACSSPGGLRVFCARRRISPDKCRPPGLLPVVGAPGPDGKNGNRRFAEILATVDLTRSLHNRRSNRDETTRTAPTPAGQVPCETVVPRRTALF